MTRRNIEISVLIATYNRGEDLRETLEAMADVDRDGLAVEFVIIDNNSSDDTKAVVESFAERLPVRYLFERQPGKNCALNKALNEVELGEIVVFTDDDVVPRHDWLMAIAKSVKQWPNISVFGGNVTVRWPGGKVPEWTKPPHGRTWGLGGHCLGDEDCPYPAGNFPTGANLWVRRLVFSAERRFNERVGPRPRNRITGSETSFLLHLERDGFSMMYVSSVTVVHRVQPELLTMRKLRHRAWSMGRSSPHMYGLCRPELFARSPGLWYLLRLRALAWATFRYVVATVDPFSSQRFSRRLEAVNDIAHSIESFKLAHDASAEKALRTSPKIS